MNLEKYNEVVFENIKHYDEEGGEYWLARELQIVLEYKEWRKFEGVIKKAKVSCENSNIDVKYHFVGAAKMVEIGSAAKRKQNDYKLTRYACYLIVQNCDSRKEVIALGQTYFAVQTRRMQLTEESYTNLSEDEKRIYKRSQTRIGNKNLNKIAVTKGVKNLDKFTNAGYKGLYNGETADDIAKRKGLRYREEILDFMGSEELSANEFRISQTEALLKKQKENSEKIATDTHYKVGRAVRKTIEDLGNDMPEDLATPKKSIKDIERIINIVEK